MEMSCCPVEQQCPDGIHQLVQAHSCVEEHVEITNVEPGLQGDAC